MESASTVNVPLARAVVSRKPLVSVVVIFLNAEQFIQEAIESVFAQAYENWELLLVDDGSSDGSTAIARRCAEQFPECVRYLEHPNHQNCGKTASRNLGIRYAAGKYIAFLDADDVWMPHKLEQQVAILEFHPDAAMVYGLSQWWYSWTGRSEDKQRDFRHELGVPPNSLLKPPDVIPLFFLTQEAAIPNPSNILARRDIIQEVNGFDETFFGLNDIYEDQAFCTKVCLRAPILAVNECWDMYRQHPESSVAIAQKAGKEKSARLFFLNWLAGYLSEHGVKDCRTWQLLRRELWHYRHPNLFRAGKRARDITREFARRIVPLTVRCWLRAKWQRNDYITPIGWVRFGSLRRVTPLSRQFGYDRGNPIDRFYIETFLSNHQTSIHGHVLEIADDDYTRRFGKERVTKSDVLNLLPGSPKTTLVADLTRAEHIPSATYDCIIITQTFQFVFDLHAAVRTLYRVLKPRGVLIATVPGISPISRYDMERWGHFWAFTSQSAKRLFSEVFHSEKIHIRSYGNVLSATAFLYGMATEELKREELEYFDPDYEVIIGVRAVKAEEP